jgi:hypothetical protein
LARNKLLKDLSTDELGQLLFSPEESIREEALDCLKLRHDEKVIMQISSALENTAPGSFFYSLVDVLGTLGDAQALPVLFGAYHRVRQDLPRLALLRSIAKTRSPESEAFLLSVLEAKTSWPLHLASLEILLSSYPHINILPRLLEAFIASPLPDKVAALLERAAQERPEWAVPDAFVLRLMLGEPLTEEHSRAAIKFLKNAGDASAIPLIESWATAIPGLRALASLAINQLKNRR